METIRNYLEMLFQRLPNTPEVQKAKFELGQMMEDKYNELIANGTPENEAVGKVIAEFGNLDELAESLGIQNYMKPGTYQWNNAYAQNGMPNGVQNCMQSPSGQTIPPQNANAKPPKQPPVYKNSTAATVMSVFWPTATCLYLSWSFLSFEWQITWVIWPLAAIIHAILGTIFKKEV